MIYFASDLHLEFKQNYNYVLNELKQLQNFAYLDYNKEEDILILLGDIFAIRNGAIKNQIFDILGDIFKDVYILFGNHEFNYGYDMCLIENEYFKRIRKNVYLVNNIAINHDNYKIIMTTLFSKIDNPYNQMLIQNGISDFEYNVYRKGNYSIAVHNFLFEKAYNFIKNNIKHKNIIIATHFAPTFMLQNEYHKQSKINNFFYTELHDFIYINQNIKYWLYGHTHYNKEVKINNTILTSNQMGYYTHINDDFEFFKSLK